MYKSYRENSNIRNDSFRLNENEDLKIDNNIDNNNVNNIKENEENRQNKTTKRKCC